MIIARTPTKTKAAVAGVILETSFARFMASMAIFNNERTPSRPFHRWGSVFIPRTRGGREKRWNEQVARKNLVDAEYGS